MTSAPARFVTVLVTTLAVLVATLVVGGSSTRPALAAFDQPVQLIIVEQDFQVAPGVPLEMTLRSPFDLHLDDIAERGSVTVSIGQPLETRDDLVAVSGGSFGIIVDSVQLALSDIDRHDDRLSITVPTETDTKLRAALRLPDEGLAPVRVDIDDGNGLVAELTTFVYRPDTTGRVLPVAIAMGAPVNATIDERGLPRVDEGDLAHLEALATVAASTPLPLFVNLPPSVVTALGRQRPDILESLESALRGRSVASAPELPLDPSGAADAGAAALYSSWSSTGDATTQRLLGANPVYAVQVMDAPLSPQGAQLLADRGTTLLLADPRVFDRLDGTPGMYADPSKVVQASLADAGETLNIKVADRRVAALLERTSTDPTLSAIRVIADLLLIRQTASATGPFGGRSVVVATSDLGVPDPDVFRAFTTLLQRVPAVHAVDITQAADDPLAQAASGRPIRVALGPVQPTGVAERIALADTMRERAQQALSMLPDDDERRSVWLQRLEPLPSLALGDGAVATIVSNLDAQIREVTDAVVPPAPFSVTLGGNRTTLRFRVRNTSSTTLRVRVHMSSSAAKVTFPANDAVVELSPNATTEITTPVVARSLGKSAVFVELLTPDAGMHIAPAVPVTARVNPLSAIGNVITATFVVLLAVWWFRHWRRHPRRRATTLPVQ